LLNRIADEIKRGTGHAKQDVEEEIDERETETVEGASVLRDKYRIAAEAITTLCGQTTCGS
jgi:hypothetical protein